MAFVRVKRRHDEDPFNSIVVSHKKLKAIGTDFSSNSVFQFAATIKDENENLSQILKKVREGKSVKNLTKHNKYKNINATIEHSKAERLKLVNTLRADKEDTVLFKEKDGDSSKITIVDFIKQVDNNDKPLVDEGISIDYVYDLYYVSISDDKSIDIQDIDSVHGLDSDKFYNICSKIDDSDHSSHCEDEDDSNDEGNWRNDYPDEDEIDNSDDEDFDGLIIQSKQWRIHSCSSSDSKNKDSDDEDSIEDYDVRFARYKERVKAEEHGFYNSVIEDSSSSSSDE